MSWLDQLCEWPGVALVGLHMVCHTEDVGYAYRLTACRLVKKGIGLYVSCREGQPSSTARLKSVFAYCSFGFCSLSLASSHASNPITPVPTTNAHDHINEGGSCERPKKSGKAATLRPKGIRLMELLSCNADAADLGTGAGDEKGAACAC